jgi:hypothetical protein
VSWVKLHSVGPNYATVKAFSGGLAINGICISSWDDTKQQQVDTNPADGRSFLLARDGGHAPSPGDSDSGRQPPLLGVAGRSTPLDSQQLAASPVVGGAPACGRSARFPASSVAAADGRQIAGLLRAGPGLGRCSAD